MSQLAHEKIQTTGEVQRILVPVKSKDDCELICSILEESIDSNHVSALRFIHVIDDDRFCMLEDSPLKVIQALYDRDHHILEQKQYLRSLAEWAQGRFPEAEVSFHVSLGDIFQELSNEIESWHACAVIMLAHRESTKWLPFRKNVILQILKTSDQQVHVIKPANADSVQPS